MNAEQILANSRSMSTAKAILDTLVAQQPTADEAKQALKIAEIMMWELGFPVFRDPLKTDQCDRSQQPGAPSLGSRAAYESLRSAFGLGASNDGQMQLPSSRPSQQDWIK